jgi:hypothetical protein
VARHFCPEHLTNATSDSKTTKHQASRNAQSGDARARPSVPRMEMSLEDIAFDLPQVPSPNPRPPQMASTSAVPPQPVPPPPAKLPDDMAIDSTGSGGFVTGGASSATSSVLPSPMMDLGKSLEDIGLEPAASSTGASKRPHKRSQPSLKPSVPSNADAEDSPPRAQHPKRVRSEQFRK